MRSRLYGCAIGATFIIAPSAFADTPITSGAVQWVATPPSDVSSNNWESNTYIRAFAEQQNLKLTQSLATDISVAGTSPSGSSENLSPSSIASGTIIDCYMLHFDKNGSNSTVVGATGSITFDEPILGLLVTADSQNAANTLLGLPGVTYSTGGDHGADLTPDGGANRDSVTLSSELRTVTVDLNTNYYADDLRIITAVPEPTSIFLLGGIVLGCASRRRFRA